MYISLWENSRGHPDNVSFMQFSTKLDGFEQKDSQGFENSYNSYEQYSLEKFFIFTIYQNYTLALKISIILRDKIQRLLNAWNSIESFIAASVMVLVNIPRLDYPKPSRPNAM